jgi:hypothetical protein
MLSETRAELDDFHHASKELEAELEAELQRTEKAQQDLRVKVAKAESERDDWKSKFISLQTTHNTITASLQRELDKLRQEHQAVKVQLRELEMGNDDLERTERAVSSTLADIEAKYTRALEEKILLEHEMLDKANVEEQCQRLRDELRDANAEISHLRDQLAVRASVASSSGSSNASIPSFPRIPGPSAEDLLSTPAPPDLQLSELDPSTEIRLDTPLSEDEATPRKPASTSAHKGPALHLQRAGSAAAQSTPPTVSSIPRSRTIPSYSSPRTPTSPSKRPTAARNPSTMSTSSTTSTASKSRGVQMVSEMRARVKNLEQKIHTRVPRLRIGSNPGRPNANTLAESNLGSPTQPSGSRSVLSRTSWENPLSYRRSSDSRRSTDTDSEKSKRGASGDTSGWVLIMEDSPSPPKERRRASSPKKTMVFRPVASTSSSPTFGSSKAAPLFQSTINTGNIGNKRPQSRLSGGSTATTTSIPTPTSRPTTPTFLPLPTSNSTTMIGQKRSTGPSGVNPYSHQLKRSSLGSSTAAMHPPGIRSGSSTPGSDNGKSLPQLPGAHANVTMRSHVTTKLPPSNALGQSRIGRPTGTRRRSADGSPDGSFLSEIARPRAGSVAAQRKNNS